MKNKNPEIEIRKSNKARIISRFALLALLAFGLQPSAFAQSTNALPATNAPTISSGLTEIWDAIESSGLTTATNYAVEPYLTYAPEAPGGNRIGGGAFIAYNLGKYLGTGLSFDYLGQFSLVSANVQLKVPTRPLSFIGSAWATNLVVAPFALAGVGTGLSGSTGGAIAVTDAGAYVQFGHLWGGRFNVGGAYGRWDNAGIYSGPRAHIFVGWSKGF
jgi:hypothetical protein